MPCGSVMGTIDYKQENILIRLARIEKRLEKIKEKKMKYRIEFCRDKKGKMNLLFTDEKRESGFYLLPTKEDKGFDSPEEVCELDKEEVNKIIDCLKSALIGKWE